MVIPGLRKGKLLRSYFESKRLGPNSCRLACEPANTDHVFHDWGVIFLLKGKVFPKGHHTYYTVISVSGLKDQVNYRFRTGSLTYLGHGEHTKHTLARLIRKNHYSYTTPDVRDQVLIIEGRQAPLGSIANNWAAHMNRHHGCSLPVREKP